MHANIPTLRSSSASDAYVDWAFSDVQESPHRSGTAVAYSRSPVVKHTVPAGMSSSQSRSASQCENSCHAAALKGKSHVADGIDASMHSMQAPCKHAATNRVVAYSCLAHLGNGDDPVLLSSHASDQRIRWAEFPVHFTGKSAHLAFLPGKVGRLTACCGY